MDLLVFNYHPVTIITIIAKVTTIITPVITTITISPIVITTIISITITTTNITTVVITTITITIAMKALWDGTPKQVLLAASVSTVCGRTEYLGRIFGGQKANPERWPWQASLLLHGRHICGAALIDKNWVASAAHCFQRSHSPSDYKILLGYNQLSHPTNFSRQMTVNKLIVHPNYDKIHRMGSDIVLMQLHRPVEFNTHILPVCIPDNTTQLSTFTPCWISGWGMITENKFLPAPLQLQEAKVALLENDFCASYYQPPPDVNPANAYIVKEDMLCASDLTNEKSICRGDSGGPLVCEVEEIWYLIGLSSWSSDCIHPIGPSVFTRITYFTNWINEKKQENPDPDLSLAPPEEEPPALMQEDLPCADMKKCLPGPVTENVLARFQLDCNRPYGPGPVP
ncbi:serine protease 40-like [Ctenodactylus gundi]